MNSAPGSGVISTISISRLFARFCRYGGTLQHPPCGRWSGFSWAPTLLGADEGPSMLIPTRSALLAVLMGGGGIHHTVRDLSEKVSSSRQMASIALFTGLKIGQGLMLLLVPSQKSCPCSTVGSGYPPGLGRVVKVPFGIHDLLACLPPQQRARCASPPPDGHQAPSSKVCGGGINHKHF